MLTRDKEDSDLCSEVPQSSYESVRSRNINFNTHWIRPAFFALISVGPFLSLSHFCLAAETIQLTPGFWEIHTSTRLPAMSQSVSSQLTQCIENGDIDPSDLLKNNGQCAISEKKLENNRMSWLLQCTVPGSGIVHGHGEFSSGGDRAEGASTMIVPHQGEDVEVVSTWSGRRIGECE